LPQIPEVSIIIFKRRFKKALRLDVSLQDIEDLGLRGIWERHARRIGFERRQVLPPGARALGRTVPAVVLPVRHTKSWFKRELYRVPRAA
jgi:hypothetical protein